MDNFIFDGASTKVIFGKDTENRVAEEIKIFGGKNVLLHYGKKSIKESGLYEKVLNLLKEAGINIIDFGGVEPNPLLSHVREGINISKKNNVDFILAVGGGSAIDSAKAIAVGIPYDGDVWDFAECKAVPQSAIPVGVILTIAAAGTETGKYSVITNEEGLLKRDIVNENNELIRPKFAILNPELTFTLPSYQTACGIVDISAHAMERYFSSTKNVDLSDGLCEAVIKTVFKNGALVCREPENYNARAEIMWAGSLAHNDLIGMGREWDFASHMIGMEITAIYGITHGATLSIIIPAWMKYVYKLKAEVFAKFAVNVFNVDLDFDSFENTALLGIKMLEDFYKEIKMPTRLSEVGVSSDKFDEIAEKAPKAGSIKELNKNDILEILKLAL